MTIDFSELTSDGDTTVIDDNPERVLRLRLVPDEGATINDYDSDGRVEWVRLDTDWSPPRHQRPDSFSGRARVINTDYPYVLWWDPPGPEILGDQVWTPEEMRKEEVRIRDLCEYGFVGAILELCEGKDAYGKWIVRDTESLWGLEWDIDGSYLAEVCSELYAEIDSRNQVVV
jgi:hypothetical protein